MGTAACASIPARRPAPAVDFHAADAPGGAGPAISGCRIPHIQLYAGVTCSSAQDGAAMTGRALVTGGAGCIGSDLALALLNRGQRVTVIDNLSSGRREHIEGLLG